MPVTERAINSLLFKIFFKFGKFSQSAKIFRRRRVKEALNIQLCRLLTWLRTIEKLCAGSKDLCFLKLYFKWNQHIIKTQEWYVRSFAFAIDLAALDKIFLGSNLNWKSTLGPGTNWLAILLNF